MRIKETSRYPWDGQIDIELTPEDIHEFTLSLRIPGWCNNATMSVNGTSISPNIERGHAKIKRIWQPGDSVTLNLPMTPERMYAHPKVQHDADCVALRRSPLVYCFEQLDQQVPVNLTRLPADVPLEAHFDERLPGGISVVKPLGRVNDSTHWGENLYITSPAPELSAQLLAIPYYIWCNRGKNEMQVWIRE